ncbi:GTPase IMAP family member 8 [Syngnathoides biaculeatus]|uniref:GTPase IMAP family member 8 n=1 Tax=Syngnathoides biaculeatus TaxID=300417 RepID=UPI002ADD5114|nr:GTPase IMAP family member 8 [Syngnathoides biaculeatus]
MSKQLPKMLPNKLCLCVVSVDGWWTSQLKLVLLGGRNSGKSSLGNLLLGKKEFAPSERTSCLRRVAPAGRHWLTVVDTPGWWCDFGAEDSARMVRREIQGSVAMCSPGPHVFLVAVKAGSHFTEKRRKALEEHVGLLGPEVWHHCVVVFTSLGTPDQKRDWELSESEALGWLRDKVGHRCHLIDLSDISRVLELMETVRRLVTTNRNKVFEMEDSVCRALEDEKRRVEDDARARFLNVKIHRAFMRERARPLPDIRIVLLGAKGSGKTSSLNTILGRDQGRRPTGRTARCVIERGAAFGRQVTVVDTPGWWMNFFVHESTAFDRGQIRLGPSFCGLGPHAFLLVVRPDRAFSETYRRAVQEHLQLLGGDVWGRVMVLFSFGDWLGETAAEQHVESEGESLQWLVERCRNRTHVLNNRTAGDGFQVRELLAKIEELVAGCGGGHWRADTKEEEQLVRMMSLKEKKRKMNMVQQKREANVQDDKSRPLSEVTLVLVGGSKTGKSSCGNTLLGHDCFHTGRPTTSCTLRRGRIGERAVTVLDTPGNFPLTTDLMKGTPSWAVLVVVNASAAFTDGHGRALEAQMGGLWRRAMVVFSHGDWLGDTGIEQRLESEGPALRELVAKCGNRYHMLDNKRRFSTSQVLQLMAKVERAMVGESHTTNGSSGPQYHNSATLCKDLSLMPSDGHQLSHDFRCSDSSTGPFSESSSEHPSVDSCESSSADKQVGLPSGAWNSGNATFCLLAVLRDRLKSFSINVPTWLHANPSRLPMMLLVLPPPRQGSLPDGYARLEHSLFSQTGDWSSLEELEAFIDSYFDTLWERQASTAFPPSPQPGWAAAPQSGEHLLSSIERKLSKLDLLEEIREDLTEVRRSLELSWKVIQDLRCKNKHQ